MPHRTKVLIIENDDFLREILGNLLHKKELYIFDAPTIEKAVHLVGEQHIQKIIIGTSSDDFEGKKTIHFLRKKFSNPRIFLINQTTKPVSYLPKQDQILESKLSIKSIIGRIVE